jgi:hypothetical protein
MYQRSLHAAHAAREAEIKAETHPPEPAQRSRRMIGVPAPRHDRARSDESFRTNRCARTHHRLGRRRPLRRQGSLHHHADRDGCARGGTAWHDPSRSRQMVCDSRSRLSSPFILRHCFGHGPVRHTRWPRTSLTDERVSRSDHAPPRVACPTASPLPSPAGGLPPWRGRLSMPPDSIFREDGVIRRTSFRYAAYA